MAKSPYVHDRVDADDEILPDGGRRTVSMMLKDGSTVELEDWQAEVIYAHRLGLDDAAALHRPGPRYCTDRAGLDAKAKAYADSVQDMCDAWQRKPVADVSGEFHGAKEGDQCTVREGGVDEGSPGHLKMINGRLVCVPDRKQSRTDAVPRMMDAAEAQRVRDEAWLQMCRDLEDAWKKPLP